MSKEFSSITYIGGIATLPQSCDLTVAIDNNLRRVFFKRNGVTNSHLNFEDIEEVSLDEKSTRSAGKTAAGAIIGGVLTGGIGLIAGAAIGARKKNASILYLTYCKGGKQFDVLLKAKGQTENLYAAISSAIATEESGDFDRSRTRIFPIINQQQQPPQKASAGGGILFLVVVILLFLLLKSCLS